MDESLEMICLDSSILIDFFRKKNKEKTPFFKLSEKHDSFAVSVVTSFEVMVGCSGQVQSFWREFFEDFTVLPLTEACSNTALKIDDELRRKNKRIDLPDLLIAATAVTHELPFATLNLKHFERISSLVIYRFD